MSTIRQRKLLLVAVAVVAVAVVAVTSVAAIRRDAIGSALHCPASTPTTDDMRQTDFLRLMVDAVPSAFEHADWLASHAYPAADPCVGSFIVS